MSQSEVTLNLGGAAMDCTAEELAEAIAGHLREIRSVVRLLRPDERVALRAIMSRPSGTLRVAEVFRDFSRDSEAHKTLRRLRAAQFVRPAQTGCWNSDELIEDKPFARLLWDRLGEGELFAAESSEHEVVITADEEETAREEAPLAEPVVAETTEEPPVAEPAEAEEAVSQPAASAWEADAVVDLGDVSDVDDFRHYVEEELRQGR
jgi:hypothetical protein